MFLPIEAVINFITDEGLGPYKIAKSDPDNWRLQINEPSMWGTNDHKWRCGIGVKQVEDEKIIVYNGFKAAALYGSDYHGSFFKFVKLIKGFTNVEEAKQYFIGKYLIGVDLKEFTNKKWKPQNTHIDEPPRFDVNIPNSFEKFDSKQHQEYADYLHARGVSDEQIKKAKLFINDEDKRIVFPVYEDGFLVFYAGRDITGKNPLPWKKSFGQDVHPIWNIDSLTTSAMIFEACFDAIQVPNGIALFGVGTEAQFKKIVSLKLNKIILAFDNDTAGRNARWKWAEWLTSHNQPGVYVYSYNGITVKDFGTMAENKIDFDIKNRIHFWDYRAKLLFKMNKI